MKIQEGHWETKICTTCKGTGIISNGEEMCDNCNGEGEIKVWIEDKK